MKFAISQGGPSSTQETSSTEPKAFWMGKETALLAFYHAPVQRSRQLAIVICPSFGHEYLVAYQALRHLAIGLACQGFPVLRMDYAQTGDSFDIEDPTQILSTWKSNIKQAVLTVQEQSGLSKVCLIGLRWGALLATSVSEMVEIDSLVLIAPVASGRSFVRELQVFHTMYLNRLQMDSSDHPCEVTGYDFPEVLQEQMKSLEFTKFEKISAQHIFVIGRDDMPGSESRILKHLDSLKLTLNLIHCPGYSAMMSQDSLHSKVPVLAWKAIEEALQHYAATVPASLPSAASFSSPVRTQAHFQETLISFQGKFGILTTPLVASSSRYPAIVMSNIGVNHRASNHRLYVQMARHFATLGFTVLRMDRSGIGDSPARLGEDENIVYGAFGVQDTQDALDTLQTVYGFDKFILAGLCSGAYFAYQTAIKDPRVVGLSLINILCFEWKHGDSLEIRQRRSIRSTEYYKRTAFNTSTWLRLVKGKIDILSIARGLLQRTGNRIQDLVKSLFGRLVEGQVPQSSVMQNLQTLLDRQVHIHFIVDSNDGAVDLLTESIASKTKEFMKHPRFRIDTILGADHTFTPRWSQAWLLQIMSEYYQKHFTRF